MTILLSIIVGAHFNPPAKGLLQALPQGASLRLVPDSGNPYDENCVDVFAPIESFPEDQWDFLRGILPGMGHDWDELMAVGSDLLLGHLPRRDGKPILKAAERGEVWACNEEFLAVLPNPEARVEFVVTGDGQPGVRMTLAETVAP